MEIPEQCIGCPHLKFLRQTLADSENDKLALQERAIQNMDAEDLLLDMSDAGHSEEVLFLNELLEQQAKVTERRFRAADKIIRFCKTEADELTRRCEKGSRHERRFLLFGKRVIRCSSRTWPKNPERRLSNARKVVRSPL